MNPERPTPYVHYFSAILMAALWLCIPQAVQAQGMIDVFQLQGESEDPIQDFPFTFSQGNPVNSSAWKKLSNDSLTVSSEEAWFVFQITLDDHEFPQGKLFLFAGSGANMEFYIPSDTSLETFHSYKSGPLTKSTDVSVTTGNSWNAKIVFTPPSRSFPIYVKAGHIFHNPIKLNPHLQTYSSRLEEEQGNNLFLGLFYGVMLFLMVYHSFFFLILRDKTYLIHVFFMVTIVGFIGYHEGTTYAYLFPHSPLLNYLLNFLLGLIPITYILFYRSYLKLYKISKKRDRWFRKSLRTNVVLQLIPILIFSITGKTAWVYTLIHVINLIFILLYSGIFAGAFSRSKRDHMILLGGLTVMVSSGLFATLSQLLGYEADWKKVIETGVLLEAIIFAIGLGYRTRRWERDKLNSSTQLVEQLKKNEELQLHFNQKLQSQVYERSQQLTEALRLAKKSAEVKSEFLTSISHEMRTPLNGIIGLTNILHEEQDSVSRTEHLDELGDSAQDLLHLVNNALDFSELEENKPARKEEFSLSESLSTLSDNLAKRATRKGLDFSLIQPHDSIQIFSDKNKFEHVLYNLTINAIKYTEAGSIRIEVRLANQIKDQLTLFFSFKDTGVGIEPEALANIFEPFQNQEIGFTRGSQGTGLGLALIHNILAQMESKLEIDTQPGVGTTFSFRIKVPGNVSPILQKNKAVKESTNLLMGKKVLLVEDHLVNQKVGLRYLRKWGMEPDLAENGEEAVTMVQQKQYDMVLMDLHMPVLDGIAATIQIKSLGEQYLHIPIIALSAATHLKEVQQQVLDAGMLDFVTKPFSPKDLRSKIEAYFLSPPA